MEVVHRKLIVEVLLQEHDVERVRHRVGTLEVALHAHAPRARLEFPRVHVEGLDGRLRQLLRRRRNRRRRVARRVDVEVEHLARRRRPLHGRDHALRRAVDVERHGRARTLAGQRVQNPRRHRRGVALQDRHQSHSEYVEHRVRSDGLIRNAGSLERDVAHQRLVHLRRRPEADGLNGDEALAQFLRQTGHRRQAEEASAGRRDQGRRVLHAVGDEDDVEIILGIGLPLAHSFVDAGADGSAAARSERVGLGDDGVPGAGCAALQKKVCGRIGAHERLRLRGGVEEDQPHAIARPLRPASRRRIEQFPLADKVLYRRLEDVDLLRAVQGARRKIVHAARLVEHQRHVEHVAALVGGRERRSYTVIVGNQAGRCVAGVLRHLRALGHRRGHDIRRHPVGGDVLRADKAHVDVLVDRACAGAEVGPEVRLRYVGDADVVAGQGLICHRVAGHGGGVAEVEGGGAVDHELRAGRSGVELQGGPHHAGFLIDDAAERNVEDPCLARRGRGRQQRGGESNKYSESD